MTPYHVKLSLNICLFSLVLVSPAPVLSLPPVPNGEPQYQGPPARIYSFSPTSGPIGTAVTIQHERVGMVTFSCNVQATRTDYSETSITVIVPAGAITGRITGFSVGDGAPGDNQQDFTVTDGSRSPVITSFSPTNGPIGTRVWIRGRNLYLNNSPPQITFNGVAATFELPPNFNACLSLGATVPSGATTGPISVSSSNGNAVSPEIFTVTTVTSETVQPRSAGGPLSTPSSKKDSSKKDSPLQVPSRSSGGESGPAVKTKPAAGNIPGVQMPTMHGAEACCAIVANASLKGRLGRVVVAFPDGAVPKNTRVDVLKDGKVAQSGYGNQSWELLSGTYEVSISGKRLSNVTVKASHDTTVKVGVLRVSAGKDVSVGVLDGGNKLTSGYGNQVIGLPPGSYDIQVAGQTERVTISEGQVTDF